MSGVKDKEEDMKERKREMNGRGWRGINSSFQAPSLSGDEKNGEQNEEKTKLKREQNEGWKGSGVMGDVQCDEWKGCQ